jgi:predicted ATP-binding protein involved in virulence
MVGLLLDCFNKHKWKAMKLRHARIEGFRAISALSIPLDPGLTVLHGLNGQGKTSVLSALAVGLGAIPAALGHKHDRVFSRADLRANSSIVRVHLQSYEDLQWERSAMEAAGGRLKLDLQRGTERLRKYLSNAAQMDDETESRALPVVAAYDTDRAVFALPERKRDFRPTFNRLDAYEDALATKPSFKALIEWFYAEENEELRRQREKGSFDYRLPELSAVRSAITRMLPDVTNPRIEYPARFMVTRHTFSRNEELSLDQLSGGYRIVLALVADLARRMVQANPYLPDPLSSEAIVLIDEVELHLHPEWQQRILEDLTHTFPNAQFIVSTHSPQVLTTISPQQIIHLRGTPQGVVAERETTPTYGAEAGDVLVAAMHVSERPPHNPFAMKLEEYQRLIVDGKGDSLEGTDLRNELEALSPSDPALMAADIGIRRNKLLRELASKE